jgi:hypothetical protein
MRIPGRAFALALATVFMVTSLAPPAFAERRTREVDAASAPTVFAEMAAEVTQKMLASQAFQRILAESSEPPKLVVGDPRNRTNDETVSVGDIERRISEVVVESGVVRWFEYGINDFDLVVAPTLTGEISGEGKRMQYNLTLTLTLSDTYGEVKGRWLVDRAYQR